MNAIQVAIAEASLSFFGEGVLATTTYPNPFPITLSNTFFQGTVGSGIAYDPIGNQTRIDPSSPTSKIFSPAPAHPTLPRWDLLVIEYAMTGDTPVPKPSDPITTINLNLHDDFLLKVIEGTPSATPAYPAKGANDIILDGLRIPAAATFGTQIVLDIGVRELGLAAIVNVPVFKQEPLVGVVNGVNTTFTTTALPFNAGSFLPAIDDRVLDANEYVYTATSSIATIVLTVPPVVGQDIKAFYVENSANSQNPISGAQEVPTGVVDGINTIFPLAGKPANQMSTLVFVDGGLVDASGWNLVQGFTQDEIQFLAGYVPQPAQNIYVFYFVNPASVGIAPIGGGPTDGRFTVFGSIGVPVVVNPAAGVPITTDARMLIFTASSGGAQAVTANPQIPVGAFVGQECMLKGTSDVNYITLNDGNGLSLNGPINLKNKIGIYLLYDGAVWSENARP